MPPRSNCIRRRALLVQQDPKHPLFMLVLTADELLRIADISRLSRDETGHLLGYQRKEVRRHVNNIVDYLNSKEAVLFPNSIILALTPAVDFKEARGPKVDDGIARAGTLTIPVPREGRPKPAWIVDGQQRALALSRCKRRDRIVPINAFLADDVAVQREQFLRINTTKPLPHGLISELLPEVDSILPPNLAAKKAPARLCQMLSQDPESPFHRLVRHASQGDADRRSAMVADTVIIKMLEISLKSPAGALFSFRNIATGETDFESVKRVLYIYWNAVRTTFPGAWGQKPEKSRLMHGVGIRSMGLLMDRVMGSVDPRDPKASVAVQRELAPLRDVCHWTSGAWDEGVRNMLWDDLQCVHGHIQLLSSYLIQTYLQSRRMVA
jgi:DGQHR domain-containing protein